MTLQLLASKATLFYLLNGTVTILCAQATENLYTCVVHCICSSGSTTQRLVAHASSVLFSKPAISLALSLNVQEYRDTQEVFRDRQV